MAREIAFVLALWKTNLLSAMEYRTAFLTQMLGMVLNNAVYFLFWVIFFERFDEINGWGLEDMLFLFGVVAVSFGAGVFLFGNVLHLSSVIALGHLDYYLSLPRPVLLHVLASRSVASGAGDITYGLLSFGGALWVSDGNDFAMILRFLMVSIISALIFISFLVSVQSLAFWIGNSALLTRTAINAIITFSLYPITLFDGTAKLLLFTLIPAAFVGALPAEFVRTFRFDQLWMLVGAGLVFLSTALLIFYRGLRHYESGSAIQVRM